MGTDESTPLGFVIMSTRENIRLITRTPLAGILKLFVCLCHLLISFANRPDIMLGQAGPEVIKLCSYSTQLSTNFILLINVKMPTRVGILTFISMINTTSGKLKAKQIFICRYFSFYEQLNLKKVL